MERYNFSSYPGVREGGISKIKGVIANMPYV